MQNPVGYEMNADKGRAELVDIWALLTNPVALAAFPHTIAASFMVAAGLIISASPPGTSRATSTSTPCGPP